MKKILITIFCSFFLLVAGSVYAEVIQSFDVNIVINEDATVDIIETMVYDFEGDQRQGIYREIPVKYRTNSGNKRTIKFDNISVTDENGQPRTVLISKEGNNKRIRVGDAGKYITGEHTYVISYTVEGAINYFDSHDEFYWNVTGDEWLVAMNSVSATVTAPTITKTDCFAGIYNFTDRCESMDVENNLAQFAQKNIEPFENLTVVIGMPAGTVYKPTFVEKIEKFLKDNWILFTPIIVFIFMWHRWLRLGKDPEGRGTIVPFYESPDNLSPAEVGMIIDEKVHPHDVSALMINLAIKGCIHIRKKDGEYTFIKQENADCSLGGEEKMLYDSIFKDNETEVTISSLKNKFYIHLAKITKNVVNTVIQKGYYAKNPKNVRVAYTAIGAMMLMGSFFVTPFFGVAGSVALALSSLSVFGFGFFMPRRTKKGAIAREEILGLKMYMETAEKDRINFHNAPEKNPERFEKLLPYAMALGVEERWAQQFKDIYNSKPEWYESAGTFNSSVFASDMHSLGTKTASAMVSQPASSASSGGSGFSGGGSGGGFGGGGGGSW